MYQALQLKGQVSQNESKKVSLNYILPIRLTLETWRYEQIESEREEKNKPCTLITKKLKQLATSDNIDSKTTSISRDKEGHSTMIKSSVSHSEPKGACS